MDRIRITTRENWNWYKVGEEYAIKDAYSYQPLGVQVFKNDNGKSPDIVQNEHFKYIR